MLSGAKVIGQVPSELASDATPLDMFHLTFDEPIDPASFVGEDDVVLKDPQGYIITPITIAPVAGSGDTEFELSFDSQDLRGGYRLNVGPDILDLDGDPMNQDGDDTDGEVTDSYSGTIEFAPTVVVLPGAPADQLYQQDFETWPPVSSNWQFHSAYDGLVSEINYGEPRGSSHLFIRDTAPYGVQSADMVVDLSAWDGQTDLWLEFWAKRDDDARNGLFLVDISPDGQTWENIHLADPETTYQHYVLDLDAAFGPAGIDLASDGRVFVRFAYERQGPSSFYDVYLDDVGIKVGDGIGPRITAQTPTTIAPEGPPLNNIRIEFDEPIDPTTFTWDEDVSLINPVGTIIDGALTPVAESGNTQFDLTFPDQNLRGVYRFNLGPDVRDLAGNLMDQNADGALGGVEDTYSGPVTFEATAYTPPAPPANELMVESFETWSTIPTDWAFQLDPIFDHLDSEWRIDSSADTFSGDYELLSDNPAGRNYATLKMDLSEYAGRDDLFLDFMYRAQSSWGRVYLDGNQWVSLGAPSFWTRHVVDLDSFAASNGISLDDSVELTFQHIQNTVSPKNAYMAFDYVRLLAGPPKIDVVVKQNSVAENAGTDAAEVYVIRSNTVDFSAPLSVTFTSSDPSEAVIHDTDRDPITEVVTIPAGESVVKVNVDAIDDRLLDGTQTVTIAGTADGFAAGSDLVDVTEHESIMVTIPDPSSAEGETVDAFVSRSNTDDMSQPLVVNLFSDDVTEATVPESITIPAFAASATFPVSAVDDGLADGLQPVVISAQVPSEPTYVLVSDSVQVEDIQGPRLSLVIPLASIGEEVGGYATTATLSRTGDTSSALTATMFSRSNDLWFPQSVTIPAGAATVDFDIHVVNDAELDGTQDVLVAAYVGDHSYARGVDTVSVTDDDLPDALTIGGRLREPLSAGTYTVLTDIEVLTDVTLTVEPGATLQFEAGTRLNIDGTLLADGEEELPIIFTSAAAVPAPGDWEGIRHTHGYDGGSTRTILDHVEIEYARTGLTIRDADSPQVTLSNADVHDNEWYGVYTTTSDGDDIFSTDVLILDSLVHHNGRTGISLNAYGYSGDANSTNNWPGIHGNEIYANASSGIGMSARYGYVFGATARSGSVRPLVSGNYIHDNEVGVYGLADEEYGAVGSAAVAGVFHNNLIVSNATAGMQFLRYNDGVVYPDIVNNTIAMNGGAGISHAGLRPYTVVRNNLVTGNATGIEAATSFVPESDRTENNNVWNNAGGNWVNYPAEYGAPTTRNANGIPADAEMNISEEPLFRTDLADADAFRIHGASACVDAGTTTSAPGDDFEGQPRFLLPDIGVYEVHAAIVEGTDNSDIITVTPGSASGAWGAWHRVDINGTVTTYDPAVYDAIYIDALGGEDRVNLHGMDGSDDAFYAAGDSSRIEVENTFAARVRNCETAYGFAGTAATMGGDKAYLAGTASDDTFVGSDGSSYLIGGGYLHATRQFDYVGADVTGSGGTDKAYFNDTAGDDDYYGEATRAWIELSSGVTNEAVGFSQTRATSSGSGTIGDRAFLTGADGQDKFIARFDIGYMFGTDYLNSSAGFEYVEADVSGTTGDDWAYFIGTAGDDTYYGAVDESRIELSNGVVNKSIGFPNHYALAEGEATGGDTAYLSGSNQDDIFVAGEGYAYTYGAGVLNSTRNFETVAADVTADGYDSAALHGTAGIDLFYGSLAESRFELSNGVVNKALGAFDTVYAYGTNGNGDEAYLSGTAGDDTFVGRNGSAYLSGSGKVNSIRKFDYVEADVTGSGGTDTATLYDSSLVDLFTADGDEASFDHGDDGDLELMARSFSRVNAYSTEGGPDKKDDDQAFNFLLAYYGSEWE